MRILAVDPAVASANSALGIADVEFDDDGKVVEMELRRFHLITNRHDRHVDRLVAIGRHLQAEFQSPVYDAVVVESQHEFGKATKKSIIPLAQVSGVAVAALWRVALHGVYLPSPKEVSTLEKEVRAEQTLTLLNMTRKDIAKKTKDVAYRARDGKVIMTAHKSPKGLEDVIDAIGLARWAREERVKSERKQKFLGQ